MNSKEFYDYKDIMKITGVRSTDTAYQIIDKAQQEFIKDNPGALIINKLIPKDYFDKKALGKEMKI